VYSLLIFLPLLASIIIWGFNKRLAIPVAGWLGSLSISGSFLMGLFAFFKLHNTGAFTVTLGNWITTNGFSFSFSFLFDSLSVLMVLMVTGIGALIHFYAIGYMKDDERFNSFFAYLTFFVFFMLVLVLSDNYLGMMIGWEGVGLCSYLLIGFWYENHEYNQAAKKAFLMNRIGDVGFILGIITMLLTFGSVGFSSVFAKASLLTPGLPAVTLICIFLLIGAIGKSAQFPLYTWLPDAMAGPTPVSALIHAATMVTAGIYMISRSHVLYSLSPFSLHVILVIGIITSAIAGFVALFQSDIKKILAYSTVSQLGMMVIALGLGAYHVALFHMLTHAFFKALLFLNAGTIIHALNGEQNAFKMGGLKKLLPFTWWTTLIGTLAITGCPPFSGAISKEALLTIAAEHNMTVFWILVFLSVLTAFYMFRFLGLIFLGSSRHGNHLHFPSFVMQWPVFILAVLSVFGGFLNTPHLFFGSEWFFHYLSSVFPIYFSSIHSAHELLFDWVLLLGSPVVLLVIWLVTYRLYAVKRPIEGFQVPAVLDRIYSVIILKPYFMFSGFLATIIDHVCIDGAIDMVVMSVNGSGKILRKAQTGKVGLYLLVMVLILIGLIFYVTGRL